MSDNNEIEIGASMGNMERDWKEIRKHVKRVPRHLAEACDKAVQDAMRDSEEKMTNARNEMANRLGIVLFD